MELSWDYGPTAGVMSPSSAYFGVDFPLPSGGPWYLDSIKYYVWPGWPDSVYQGFGVACWKMVSGSPGPIVWPANGIPAYDPNTDGNWIVHDVSPVFNLNANCPNGFMVGISTLYTYPACDTLGLDNLGPGPHDWANYGYGWVHPSFGHLCMRALVDDVGGIMVEPETLGSVRALFR